MVSSTWDLIDKPGILLAKLPKAASNINDAGGPKQQHTWDLAYLHQYFFEPGPAASSDLPARLRAATERVICLAKGATGWRSDDLAGIYIDKGLSFRWHEGAGTKGLYLRHFDAKAKKKQWSSFLFIPRLIPKYQAICLCSAIKELLALLEGLQTPKLKVRHPDKTSANTMATPLLLWAPKQKSNAPVALQPLAPGTIANYFGKAFMDNVTMSDNRTLSDVFKKHSSRHAVASALRDMGLNASRISQVTMNSANTLTSTYFRTVLRDWDLPQQCITALGQNQPVALLLLPFVHFHSTNESSGRSCDCLRLCDNAP